MFKDRKMDQLNFDDQEQVNFFMKKLCEELKLDACKFLDV